MTVEGGVIVVRLRCAGCGMESIASTRVASAPCQDCGGERQVIEQLADRRAGSERRGPNHLQRMWDLDPRSWFDRRRA
jgi:hypothetical protein